MKNQLIFVVVMTACIAGPLRATPVHSFDLEKAVVQSDLIVVGRVLTVLEVENTTVELDGGAILPATRYRATLKIDRVIKSSFNSPTLSVDFLIPESPVGLKGVDSGRYAIFFLKRERDGWIFFDPTNPDIPAAPGGEPVTGTPLDQVTALLGQVVTSSTSTERDYFQALTTLGRLKTDFSRQLLKQALERSTGHSRLYIARTLVAEGDLAGLPVIEQALLQPDGLPENEVAGLANSLRGLKNPRAVPTLSKLIGSRNSSVRLGVAVALRQSGSSAAIAPLTRLLNDPDKEVLYYAVIGLGEITHQDQGTPAMQEFADHEKRYLDYWRQWAETNNE